MGEILGIGVTHYPGLIQPDEQMAGLLNRTLNSVRVQACRMDCQDPIGTNGSPRIREVMRSGLVRDTRSAFETDKGIGNRCGDTRKRESATVC
jgi:hypothetical protein